MTGGQDRLFGGSHSLLSRVARATLVAAALSSSAVAIVSALIADNMIIASEDQQLQEASRSLWHEIFGLADPVLIAQKTAEEDDEINGAGLSLALFTRDGQRVGGDPSVEFHGLPGCESAAIRGTRYRRCVKENGDYVMVLLSNLDEHYLHRRLFIIAALAAVALAAGASLLSSRFIAQWAIGPLTRLQAAVNTVNPQRPGQAALGAAEGCEEVDAMRESLRSSCAASTRR
jgi:hypothetical protein